MIIWKVEHAMEETKMENGNNEHNDYWKKTTDIESSELYQPEKIKEGFVIYKGDKYHIGKTE